jgi:uncharacterized DUF497 family protein
MEIRYSTEKDAVLRKTRGIGFEDVKQAINSGCIVRQIDHPNQKKYPNQRILLVLINNYIFAVPFIEEKEYIFLKTVIPHRKYTKLYLQKKL